MHNKFPKTYVFLDQYDSQIFKNNNINLGIIYRNYKAKKRINFSAKFKLEKGFEQYYKWYKYKVNEIRK